MRYPDFLLIGAAKSGTVSLYHYLNQHPDIFMCPVNETNFFGLLEVEEERYFKGPGDRAYIDHYCIRDLNEYQRLFQAARPEQICGESSPFYLYSLSAPGQIKLHVPDVRLIAILRHPTQRAYSHFLHFRRAGLEPHAAFGDALSVESERIALGWGPLPMWHYREMGYYATQLKRYFGFFSRSQIFICLFEDLQAAPEKLLRAIFAFIGVSPSFSPDVSTRHNLGGRPRSRVMHTLLTSRHPIPGWMRKSIPRPLRNRLKSWVLSWYLRKPPLSPAIAEQLNQLYREDILQLEDLIDRDLSHWLS